MSDILTSGREREPRRRRLAVAAVLGIAAAVAGCSAGAAVPTGTVRGTLQGYPGPMPVNGKPPADPMSGKVTFTDKNGHAVYVKVPDTGKFSVQLAAGMYTALLVPTDMVPVQENVRVQPGRTLTITIVCSWDSGSCG